MSPGGGPPFPNGETRAKVDDARQDIRDLQKWQRKVIALLAEMQVTMVALAANQETFIDEVRGGGRLRYAATLAVGSGVVSGTATGIAVWLLTGHKP